MAVEPNSTTGARRATRRPGEDRALAWLVTGPLGRGVAFSLEFALALGRVLARRLR